MIQYTEKAIQQTFQEMLTEMPFDKITVTELVKRCEISPNTFYYHYNNIIEFLEEHKQIVIDELNQIPEVGKTHNKENLTEIFRVLKGKNFHFL